MITRSILLFFMGLLCLTVECSSAQEAFPSWETTAIRQCIEHTKGQTKMIVFVSPDCPICQRYTSLIKQINQENPSIAIFLVFAGRFVKDNEIRDYKQTYGLNNLIFAKDPQLTLAKQLKAHVTPECLLFDENGFLRYQGAIDNSMYAIGKKRQVVNHHYLLNALSQLATHQPITTPYTRAIGCLIE